MVGSIPGGIMLGQAIYWSGRTTLPDGWFYKSQEDWQEETMLTRYEQESVRRKLRTFSFWQEDLRGVPATMHYRVDMLNLRACLQTSLRKTSKLDCCKTASKKGENQQTFTSSETTQEITQRRTNTMSAEADASLSANPEVKEFLRIYERERGPLPEVRAMNAKRLSKCRSRLLNHKADQQKFLVDFTESIRRAAKITWPSWRPGFDWFVDNDSNYLKVLEGNYDRWGQKGAPKSAAQREAIETARQRHNLERFGQVTDAPQSSS